MLVSDDRQLKKNKRDAQRLIWSNHMWNDRWSQENDKFYGSAHNENTEKLTGNRHIRNRRELLCIRFIDTGCGVELDLNEYNFEHQFVSVVYGWLCSSPFRASPSPYHLSFWIRSRYGIRVSEQFSLPIQCIYDRQFLLSFSMFPFFWPILHQNLVTHILNANVSSLHHSFPYWYLLAY